MSQPTRHQCLIYDGSPVRNLPALAVMIRQKLAENYRCLYLNSPPMANSMRGALAISGVDVVEAEENGRLILATDQGHLVEGRFNVDHMMDTLAGALAQALHDGHTGLFATGDMTWQLGPDSRHDSLLEYEWRLEEFFRHNPGLSGVCQYHADTLPPETVREGLIAHRTLFINETLLRVNAHYVPPDVFVPATLQDPALDGAIAEISRAADKPDGDEG